MIILLSNDDGYLADGINVLASHLREIAEVIIFAPKSNHSGSSSALSLRSTLQIEKIAKKSQLIEELKKLSEKENISWVDETNWVWK